jgi:hypothetical protein
VKPATDPSDGSVIETKTTRRIIPVSEFPEPKQAIDAWEYIRAIPPDWARHFAYLRRIAPEPPVTLIKTASPAFTFPNGEQVPVGDPEELEMQLGKQFGGGTFRILVKHGSQIMAAVNIPINLPPRPIVISPDSPNGNGQAPSHFTSGDAAAQIAGKAIDAVAAQETLGIRVGVEALNAAANLQALAANTIKNFTTNPTPAPAPPSEMDQMFKVMMMRWMEKSMERLDAPPAQPTAIPGVDVNLLGRFLSTVIERGLNPPVATNGNSVSGVAAVASVLPQVLSYGAQIAAEIRMKAEAERDTVIAARSPQPPQVQPPQPRAQVLPPSTPAPAPNPNGTVPMGAPSTEFVESRIIQILQQPTSAEEAADAVLMFLHTIDGPDQADGQGSVAQLVKLGESGLVQLFQFRPKLKPATANMPRLLEFIRAFLKLYAEDQAEEAQQAPMAPPLPN